MPTTTTRPETRTTRVSKPAPPPAAPRPCAAELRAAQQERWARENQEKADKAAVTLKSLAIDRRLFLDGKPNPEAQKRIQDPDKARAFLAECAADEDLRRTVIEQGIDLDDLAEWVESGGKE